MMEMWHIGILDILATDALFIHRLVLSECVLLIAVLFIQRFDMWIWAKRVLLLFWLSVCLLFPSPVALALLGVGLFADRLMTRANLYKIAQNHMPITASDIAITARDPAVIFHLFGYSKQWVVPSLLLLAGLGAGAIYAAMVFVVALSFEESLLLVLVLLTFLVSFMYLKRRLFVDCCTHFSQENPFGAAAFDSMGWTLSNWQCDSICMLSTHLGLPAFLLYTHSLAQKEVPEFFHKIKPQQEIPASEVIKAAQRYIPSLPSHTPNFKQPNIVVMQCESIFDTARAFNLASDYTNDIFTPNAFTKCICPLRVNIIGGGSWISEFEFITGLDTRLFGYIGYYSHFSLAPHVVGALPAFLANHGYNSNAFLATSGNFYNAEVAYRHYGLQGFYESQALALANSWASSDFELAGAFVQKTPEFSSGPFFSYIVTNGAHSPYPPDDFWEPVQWTAMFQKECAPYMNAQLNEYLKRQRETEGAMKLILDRLIQIEKETGRPFVFAMYGDHQPHDFIGNSADWANYDEVRSAAPKNQTFMHVMSSMNGFELNLKDEVPLTLLPSIISASVAANHKDIYAPVNMYLYEKNGADLFPDLAAPTWFGATKNAAFTQHEEVQAEIRNRRGVERAQAVAALKSLNIMKA
jgi:phosphoglycerol transferase MdoB-like AlkP superfamily enzyme